MPPIWTGCSGMSIKIDDPFDRVVLLVLLFDACLYVLPYFTV
jgi:hypothetical protein